MSFPKHCDYKDSGVAWLGKIPIHWNVGQSRRLFALRNERANPDDEQLTASQEHGVIPQKMFMELEGRSVVQVILNAEILKHVEPGDFVISMRSFQGGIEYATHRGCISSAYVMLMPSPKIHGPFFKYLLKSRTYIQALQSTTNLVRDGQALRYQNFTLVDLPLVPLDEQKAISSFLDVETSKIDGLVSEQRRLIELLKEKRQAVISHAITKGLNPNAPTKPSGIQWLGDVPQHWDVQRIKHAITSIEQGWSPQCEISPVENSEQWGVLKVGCVNYGRFTPEENKALPPTLDPQPELGIRGGDLLISRANTIELVGSAAVAERDYDNLMLCDKLYRLRMDRSHLLPRFLCYFLTCEVAREPIELGATGASPSMKNIAQSVILELWFAAPDIDEQKEIVKAIRERWDAITTLIAEAERAIELLQERRTALISAAVTGKIDVRGFVSEAVA